jgi:hypothetical protein
MATNTSNNENENKSNNNKTKIQCVWLVRYGLTEHALIEGECSAVQCSAVE